jgi:hypothetical protein
MNDYKNKKELKKERQEKGESFKKIKEVVLWVIAILFIGYGIFWLVTLPKLPQSEIISSTGIHWHPKVSITIKGEKVIIPAGIGIGAVHNPMHTHETDGTIHMEYGGVVREDDTRLGKFFDVWGEDFSGASITGNISGEGGTLKMMVNGVENFEFENYMMKDGDVIEIIFE